LKEVIEKRPKPRDKADANCVFLTTEGGRFLQKQKRSRTDYVAREFGKAVKLLELATDGRRRLSFYALRHTLATRGLELPDRDAVKAILGHSPLDVTAGYNHAVPADERLQIVVEHVRKWLFNGESAS
jgi:integrase